MNHSAVYKPSLGASLPCITRHIQITDSPRNRLLPDVGWHALALHRCGCSLL